MPKAATEKKPKAAAKGKAEKPAKKERVGHDAAWAEREMHRSHGFASSVRGSAVNAR